jgi:hypothetical protein
MNKNQFMMEYESKNVKNSMALSLHIIYLINFIELWLCATIGWIDGN